MIENPFDITKVFPGIDDKKIQIVAGGSLDGNNVTVNSGATSFTYLYNCGTANNKEVKLEVTINPTIQKGESSVQITTQSLDKKYDGEPVSEPEYTTTGSQGSCTFEWKEKKGDGWVTLDSTPMEET